MSKGVKRKQSSAVNNLLYFMIVLAIIFILYMLYEEDIQSFLGKDKKEIVKQEVKQEQVVQSNDDWYFRNERFYQKYRLITEYIVDVKSPLNKVLNTLPNSTLILLNDSMNLSFITSSISSIIESKSFLELSKSSL